jgi:predicted branched-subunit amino acid permease
VTIDESTAVALAFEHEGPGAGSTSLLAHRVGCLPLLLNLRRSRRGRHYGALGSPASLGLDAAVPAAFLALVWPRLNATTPRVVALVACTLALVTTPSLALGLPLVVAAGVAVVAGWRR